MTDRLLLSIVIVNWNVVGLLRACLMSLDFDSPARRNQWEVIVVDNASADGSTDMVRSEFPAATLIQSMDNLGFAAGCQLGYEQSRGKFVLLLNPDTEVPDGAIEQMLADMETHPDAGILGSLLTNSDGSFQRAAGGSFPTLHNVAWNYLFLNRLLPGWLGPPPVFLEDDQKTITEVDWVSGAAMLFRRSAVGERIFDPEYFMFGEDMALCARISRQGWKVLFSPRQAIMHHHGQSYRKQSSRDVLETIYRGPRTFFRATHGPIAWFAYDSVLLIGYLLRWLIASALHVFRPGDGYREMARFSRNYVSVILRSAWGR